VPDVIPLFPLGSTVLFPGVLLPLHIFEPRYRELVRDLLNLPDGESRRFGVIAIREGWEVGGSAAAKSLHRIGCTAQVRRIKPHADGRFDVIGVGAHRFELLDLDQDSHAYLSATVRWLDSDEDAGAEATMIAHRAGAVFGGYAAAVAGLQGIEAEPLELPDDPAVLSYLLASSALLSLHDRQLLLAESSTVRRLHLLTAMLRRESLFVQELRAVPVPLIELSVPRSAN